MKTFPKTHALSLFLVTLISLFQYAFLKVLMPMQRVLV